MESERAREIRVLIISLSTYAAPYNDGKLKDLGTRLGNVTAVSGDGATLWGRDNHSRTGPGYGAFVLPLRFATSNATATLVGLNEIARAARPTVLHLECEPWQSVATQSVRLGQRLCVPIGIHFAEEGRQLEGIGGAMRRMRGAATLKRCAYAVGWSTASTRIAERLAPGIRTDTFPVTGVSLSSDPPRSTEEWFGVGSGALPKLAFVGRFAEEKGVRDFLEVCDALERRLPLRVAIAGGEGEHEMVSRWAQGRPWALLHGILPRPEVSALLAAADVLICPSRTTRYVQEQFGKAAVEAMAVGTPVFAYDCGALSETIGMGGVAVPEGAQGQLVGELVAYFTGPVSRQTALAERAQRQAMRFSDHVLADKLIDLWSEVQMNHPRESLGSIDGGDDGPRRLRNA
jgi:glycosyltransferase involved in cell wall biosynthesis